MVPPLYGGIRHDRRQQRHDTLRDQIRFGVRHDQPPEHRDQGTEIGMRNTGKSQQAGIPEQFVPRIAPGSAPLVAARRPGHQREGTLFGHLRIGNTFAPVGKFDGSHLHGIGDPESGQFQLPHILPVEETGKVGIGPLGSRDSTDRRQAHTVIQSIRFPPILHRIGHHAVPLPAKTPQQGSHPRRIIHWFSGFWEPEGLSYGRTGKRAAPARPAPARQR